jgi:beta-lactamase regulating signal transducer with metallopeptidase domain
MIHLDSLWATILTGSLRASALIVCALVLRVALRGRIAAQWFHILWLFVAARLLFPR